LRRGGSESRRGAVTPDRVAVHAEARRRGLSRPGGRGERGANRRDRDEYEGRGKEEPASLRPWSCDAAFGRPPGGEGACVQRIAAEHLLGGASARSAASSAAMSSAM